MRIPTATLTLTAAAMTRPNPQTVNLSDKTQLAIVKSTSGMSYVICANNSGGSGKWYIYDSSVGGSVQAAATAITTLASCT